VAPERERRLAIDVPSHPTPRRVAQQAGAALGGLLLGDRSRRKSGRTR
jgi:hypothetical protein